MEEKADDKLLLTIEYPSDLKKLKVSTAAQTLT